MIDKLFKHTTHETNRSHSLPQKRIALVFLSMFIPIIQSAPAMAEINVPDYVHSEEFKQINNIYFFDKDAECLPGTAPSASPATASTATSSSSGSGENNVATVYNFLLGKGLSPVQALGIIGNFMKESGANIDPNVRAYDASGAFGIAQWLGSRKDDIGAAPGRDTIEGQLDFVWQELTGGYKSSTLDPLLQITDIREATDLVLRKYEIPCVGAGAELCFSRELEERVAFAIAAAGDLGVDVNSASATTPMAGMSTSSTVINCGGSVNGSVTLLGDKAFPLAVTKDQILNPSGFYIDTHENYTAFDILVDQGISVVAYMSGEVISVKPVGSGDRCGGASLSIYNSQNDITVTYMHLSQVTVSENQQVAAGDAIGITGGTAEGCGTAHLHIDAIPGNGRPSCSRLSCSVPDGTFVDIGPDLKSLYDSMP